MIAQGQLDEDGLSRLVAVFYERVRRDVELGPIFNDAIADWPAHLSKLTDFWHSVMLTSGRFKGNPMMKHLIHRARIRPDHFDRWLALWDTVTSAGVFFTWGFWRKVMRMSLKEFSTGFAQTLPEKDKAPAYERYIVPAPGRIFFQGAFGIDNGIAWKSPTRPPLLIIEGAEDRTADPAMVRSQFRKQSRAPSPTELKVFPGRSHFICLEPGWEHVADYALEWAVRHAASSARSSMAA